MKPATEMTYAQWLFYGVAAIHVWIGVAVLKAGHKLATTALYDIYPWFGAGGDNPSLASLQATAIACIIVGVMAFVAVPVHRFSHGLSFALLIPQQVFIIISSLKAWWCIQNGSFADGAKYDPDFISADQCYIFCIGLFSHLGLVVHVYVWPKISLWRDALAFKNK